MQEATVGAAAGDLNESIKLTYEYKLFECEPIAVLIDQAHRLHYQ